MRLLAEPLEERRMLSADGLFVYESPIIPVPDVGFVVEYHPWHNARDFADVNGIDGVTPFDALLVINELLAHGSHDLVAPPEGAFGPPYVDVNLDDRVTPNDVLQVINQLIEQGAAQASAFSNTRLTLEGSFDPTAPTVVRFTDTSGHSIEVAALSVTDSQVETVVPVFFDVDHQQLRTLAVSVSVEQDLPGGSHPIYDSFLIKSAPLTAWAPGAFAGELVHELQVLTGLNLADYRQAATNAGIDTTADYLSFDSLLESELDQLHTVQALFPVQPTSQIPVDLYVDTTDPAETQFTLQPSWISTLDRQIAGWLAGATGQSEPITPDDLHDYLASLIADARVGRATGDLDAVARARQKLGEMTTLTAGTIFTAVSLEHEVAAHGHVSLAPIAAAESVLAIVAAGFTPMADLEIVAGELRGTSVDDYRATIDELAHSGFDEVLRVGAAPLANLRPSPAYGPGHDLLSYAGGLGDALGALHNPRVANSLGELGARFDAAMNEAAPLLPLPEPSGVDVIWDGPSLAAAASVVPTTTSLRAAVQSPTQQLLVSSSSSTTSSESDGSQCSDEVKQTCDENETPIAARWHRMARQGCSDLQDDGGETAP